MRLFFIGWSGKNIGLADVVSELKKKHEIVYWSGDKLNLEVDKSRFTGTIFHEHYEALAGIPAKGVDASQFLPPSEALLKQLLDVESTALTMMNKRFENILVSERKHLYYHYVQYWNGVLTKFKPDAIIFPCAPHTVYDYVVYGLAKLLFIQTIFFELTVVSARSLAMKDFVTGSEALRKEIADAAGRQFKISDLSPDILQYYERQLDAGTSHTPAYILKQLNMYAGLNKFLVKFKSFWTSLTVLKDFSVFIKIISYLPRRFSQNMKTEYLSVQSRPDFTKKFIYAPLNYQPERTSSPQGGVFVDQLLMLEILSASLPEDWLIYVKEHPAQWLHRGPDFFSYRYRGYYEEITKLKNVRLAPISTDNYALIRASRAVATLTGTAGWEAILRFKPVIIFGYPWYQQAPGLLKVKDAESCKAAIEKIKNGFAPSSQQVINYLVSFDKTSFLGYCEPFGREIYKMETCQNAESIVRAIETELKNKSYIK